MDWAGRIKALRKRLGLSIKDFAKILPVSPVTVSRWENRHSKPHECEQVLIAFIEEDQEAAEELLSIPITETSENPGERIRRLREHLGLSQEFLARLLFVTPQAVKSWENGWIEGPIGCSLRFLDWLEFHREKAAPFFWPQMLKAGEVSILKARHDSCRRFLDHFLETHGTDSLKTIEANEEWEPDRIVALRIMLDLSVPQFANVLGTREWTVDKWQTEGISGQDSRNRCWRMVLTLFERYPKEMMALRKAWPLFI